jgi:hypothetical protein
MTEAEQYFREKIEREARFYETRAARIPAGYREKVERLAKSTTDKALAHFYRETMTPRHILSTVADIRALARAGKIGEADYSLDILKNSIRFVEDRLRQRYFDAGAKVRAGGIAGATSRRGSPEARAKKEEEMRKQWGVKRSHGLSKGKADLAVAKTCHVSTRTVRKARTGK